MAQPSGWEVYPKEKEEEAEVEVEKLKEELSKK